MKEKGVIKMKKLLVILLAGIMAISCVACGGKSASKLEVADATELLTNVWDSYATEEEKPYFVGGDFNAPVEGEPGVFNLEDKETLEATFCVPADTAGMLDDAATLMHAINGNNLTSAAYHVADTSNVKAVISAIKEAAKNQQWMCGFPETLFIATVGEEYVVVAFGSVDNVTKLKDNLSTIYADAVEVAVDEAF